MNTHVTAESVLANAKALNNAIAWRNAAETLAQLLAAEPAKVVKKSVSKFDPQATLSENVRQHGTPAPWQLKRVKGKLKEPVHVRVTFSDGVVCNHSTYRAKADGTPDTDAIVRAEREGRMRKICTRTSTIQTAGRTWPKLYIAKIPAVVAVEIVPPDARTLAIVKFIAADPKEETPK